MFECDRDFTLSYINTLHEFAKFLQRSQHSIQCHRGRFEEFISRLRDETNKFLKISTKKPANLSISIQPNIVFECKSPRLKKKNLFFSVGGHIKIEDNLLKEQSLVLSLLYREKKEKMESGHAFHFQCYEFDKGYHMIRRFHFDIDMALSDPTRPKSHLQYGGKFKKEYLPDLGESLSYKLFSALDHPRIPLHPYCLITLLDFSFREFMPNDTTVFNEKGWLKHVIDSEDLWLKPYYEKILKIMETKNRNTPIHHLNQQI